MPSTPDNRNALNPLPSLIRASAQDAGSMNMQKHGRSAWSRADYNVAVRTQERLIRACFTAKGDPKNSPACFIRFSVAEQLQRDGKISLSTPIQQVHRLIDAAVCTA